MAVSRTGHEQSVEPTRARGQIHCMTSRSRALIRLAAFAAIVTACATASSAGGADAQGLPVLDSARLVNTVFRLAHDSMAGRATGTPENGKARAWLEGEVRRIGLEPVGTGFQHA